MKKISSLKRRILIALIFVFVLGGVAPTVVFYSLGYRFDWNKKIFVHSGTIVVKSLPQTVKVSLDGKEVTSKNIDFINQTTNINGITPKKYSLKVSASGYQTWEKESEVHSGIATEYWNVLLPPINLNKKNLIEGDILLYSFSPDKSNLAYFIKQDEWISLFVRDKNEKDIFVYKESLNQRFVPKEGELKWSGDGNWLIFSLKQEGSERIFLTSTKDNYQTLIPLSEIWQDTLKTTTNQKDLNENSNLNQNGFVKVTKNDNRKNILTSNSKAAESGEQTEAEKAIEASYSWDKSNNVYFLVGGTLYFQSAELVFEWWQDRGLNLSQKESQKNGNLNKPELKNSNSNLKKDESYNNKELSIEDNKEAYPKIVGKDLGGFTFCDNFICAVSLLENKVVFINENGTSDSVIDFPVDYKTAKKYKLFAYGSDRLAVLDNDDNLFVWDKKTLIKDRKLNLLHFLMKGVREVYFSDDGKKLLFATKKEAHVYFLKDWEVQPKHLAGDMELIFSQEPDMERVQWYLDYQHVFIVNKDAVKIVELDKRGGQNIFDFFLGQEIVGFDYSTGDKKAWFTEGTGLEKKLKEISFPESSGFIQSFINRGQSVERQ